MEAALRCRFGYIIPLSGAHKSPFTAEVTSENLSLPFSPPEAIVPINLESFEFSSQG